MYGIIALDPSNPLMRGSCGARVTKRDPRRTRAAPPRLARAARARAVPHAHVARWGRTPGHVYLLHAHAMTHVCSCDCSFSLRGPRPVCKQSGRVHECSLTRCLQATAEGDVVCTWTGLAHDARVDGGYGGYETSRDAPPPGAKFRGPPLCRSPCHYQELSILTAVRTYVAVQRDRGTPLTSEEIQVLSGRVQREAATAAAVAVAQPTAAAVAVAQPMAAAAPLVTVVPSTTAPLGQPVSDVATAGPVEPGAAPTAAAAAVAQPVFAGHRLAIAQPGPVAQTSTAVARPTRGPPEQNADNRPRKKSKQETTRTARRKCCDGRFRLPTYLEGAEEALKQISKRQCNTNATAGWLRSTDMPKALDDVLYAHRGVDAFHGTWCTSDCTGYIAAHVDELPSFMGT